MAPLFALQVGVSFVVVFVWITVLTVAAERLGTRTGGALAGIPATMVVALFFIGLIESPSYAASVTTGIPLVVGVNALFAVVYVFFRTRPLWQSLSLALLFWVVVASVVHASGIHSFPLSVALFFAFIVLGWYLLEKALRVTTVEARKVRYSMPQLVERGFLSGAVVASAVLGAHFGGPLLGGILASFPALTVALIVIMHRAQGGEVTASLLKHFIIGGTFNVLVFVVLVRYSFPTLGVSWGTAVSFLGSLVMTPVLYRALNARMK